MEDLERRRKEFACEYSTEIRLALTIEYEKVYNSLKNCRKDLQKSIEEINRLAKDMDKKGKELVEENFLFCMLCRNRVWGLTKIIPDFATDYLTMSAYSEFINTFEGCDIQGPTVDVAIGDFVSLMKIRP